MGDIGWEDMPEELALQLYDLTQRTVSPRTPVSDSPFPEFLEWLQENIETCKSEPYIVKHGPQGRCGELPVPGSEFCPIHIPREDIDG